MRRDYGVVLCLVAFMASNLFTPFQLKSQLLAIVASSMSTYGATPISMIETNPERQVEFPRSSSAPPPSAAVGYHLSAHSAATSSA